MPAGKSTNVNYTKTSATIASGGTLSAAGGSLSLSASTTSVATASKDAGSATVVTAVSGSVSGITVAQAYQGVKFIIKT